MFYAAVIIEPVLKEAGVELVITSGTDGKHGLHNATLHSAGLALDIRSRDLKTPDRVYAVADKIRATLPPAYDVVVEGDHIHVEYDPKPGESV